MPIYATDPESSVTDQLDSLQDVGVFARCSKRLSKEAEGVFADTLHKQGLRLPLIGPTGIYVPVTGEPIADGLETSDAGVKPCAGVNAGLPLRTVQQDSRIEPFLGDVIKMARFHGYMLAIHLRNEINRLSAEYGAFRAKRTETEAYIELPIKLSKTKVNGMDSNSEHPCMYISVTLIPDIRP